ncbi:MAG: hypothetical protein SGBAC_012557 [Bacillariaceae sp.]
MSSSDEVVRVVACVIRRNTSIDLGITFRQDVVNGCLVIESIAANGIFANTGIKLDQQLVKFNGHRCFRISKSKLEKTEMLLKQSKGIVTLEVQTPNLVVAPNTREITEHQVFTIQKATKSFQLGLGLEKIQTPADSLRIVKVSPTFQKVLGLSQGLQLVSVNGSPCNANDIESVHEQMRLAYPLLSLGCIATAINPNVPAAAEQRADATPAAAAAPVENKEETVDENLRVIACVLRANVEMDLGITFRRGVQDGHLEINSVSKSGFFGKTALRPGLRVVRINGHRISKKRMDQAVALLQQARGLVTVEAYKPATSKPSDTNTITERQVFCIQKATKAFPINLGLERIQTPDDTVRITEVSPTFQKVLGLQQGLQVTKVNGEKCNPLDIDSVKKQISDAFPMVVLDCVASAVIEKGQQQPEEEEEEEDDENVRVVACMVRPPKSPLGVTFHPDIEKGCLAIDSVDKSGLFASTGLKAGQFIVRINGKRVSQKNLDQATGLLEKISGRITLEAISVKDPDARSERRFLSIQKASKNMQIDINMGAIQLPEESAPSLRVLEVPATFQKLLGLLPGLQLLKINGARCNMNDIPSVHTQMDQAFPLLTIECIATFLRKKDDESVGIKEIKVNINEDDEKSSDIARVVACVMRPNPAMDLGLTFTKDIENGRLVVESVAADGIFAGTGLEANQRLTKINGKPTPKRKLDSALESLQKAKGRITLEAESITRDPNSTSERQVFSIQKPHQKFQLGLGLSSNKTDEGATLKISKASVTLERVLGLKQGLQLAKINGIPCNVNDIQAVQKQMDEAFPILSLECVASIEKMDMTLKRVDSDLTAGSSTLGAVGVDPEEEARLAAEAKAEEEARIKAEEDLKQKAEEEARLAAELRAEEEEQARLKAEEEARFQAESEAKAKADEEARLAAEAAEAARLQAEEDSRLAAEAEEASRKAEEESKAKAEEEARLKAEAEAKAKAEEQVRLKAEEEARIAAEEADAARLKAEEEAKLAAAAEATRKKAEEEAKAKAEAETKAKEEALARAMAEEEARKKAEEEFRQRQEEEAKRMAEAMAKAKAAEEARIKAEEDARLKAEEEFRLRTEEMARKREAQEAKEKAQEEARLKAYQESRMRAEEEARLWEEASMLADEEAKKAKKEEEKKKEAREKRITKSREAQKKFGDATGGGSGFGFFSSGLNDPLIKVKEKKEEEDDLMLPPPTTSTSTGLDDLDEVDDLIRAAEERQAQIEKELLDLAWDDL